VTKDDIYKYCSESRIEYREDESNQSDVYTRNRIRKYIIPALAEETFSVYEHSRSISEQLSEDEAFFNLQVDQLM
ncbi:tRNA(Ile)-lysidine synthetase, partial [Acinetobacter baumannii]